MQQSKKGANTLRASEAGSIPRPWAQFSMKLELSGRWWMMSHPIPVLV
jgi:hypothetical protein